MYYDEIGVATRQSAVVRVGGFLSARGSGVWFVYTSNSRAEPFRQFHNLTLTGMFGQLWS